MLQESLGMDSKLPVQYLNQPHNMELDIINITRWTIYNWIRDYSVTPSIWILCFLPLIEDTCAQLITHGALSWVYLILSKSSLNILHKHSWIQQQHWHPWFFDLWHGNKTNWTTIIDYASDPLIPHPISFGGKVTKWNTTAKPKLRFVKLQWHGGSKCMIVSYHHHYGTTDS